MKLYRVGLTHEVELSGVTRRTGVWYLLILAPNVALAGSHVGNVVVPMGLKGVEVVSIRRMHSSQTIHIWGPQR